MQCCLVLTEEEQRWRCKYKLCTQTGNLIFQLPTWTESRERQKKCVCVCVINSSEHEVLQDSMLPVKVYTACVHVCMRAIRLCLCVCVCIKYICTNSRCRAVQTVQFLPASSDMSSKIPPTISHLSHAVKRHHSWLKSSTLLPMHQRAGSTLTFINW